MKPPKSILDPSFKYTSAACTDIRKTFARARWEAEHQADIAKRQKDDYVELIESLQRELIESLQREQSAEGPVAPALRIVRP